MSSSRNTTSATAGDWLRWSMILAGLCVGAWGADAFLEARPELAWAILGLALVLIAVCAARAFKRGPA